MMKTIIYGLITGFFILYFGCTHQKKLFYLNMVTANFDKSEISDLYKILNNFDDEVCKIYGGLNLEENYKFFLTDFMKNNFSGNGDWVVFKPEKQKALLNSISKSTFKKIWVEKTICKSAPKDSMVNNHLDDLFKVVVQDSVKYLDINTKGEYFEFLKLMADKNPNLKYYVEIINGLQTATDGITIDVLLDNKISKMCEDEMRLIIVIQFLILYDDISQNTLL